MQHVPVNCYVCGSREDREFQQVVRRTDDGSGGTYRVAQCRACGFLYINPRPAPDELIELYRKHSIYFREDYEPVSQEMPVLRGVMRDIRRFLPGGSLLEIGCGRGELLELARKAGFQVYGCDLQRSPALDPAIPIHLGAMSASPFPDQSFDCIVMRNTLEHLFDPATELQICHRLLKPGGFLYLKAPNGAYEHGWRSRLMMRSHVFGPPWHLNYFTPTTLRRLLLQKKFQLVDWLIESPTPDPRPLLNAAQSTAFAALRAARLLTLRTLFPKPLLTCMARKLPVSSSAAN
jgi:SAM-dependent methyltransferase